MAFYLSEVEYVQAKAMLAGAQAMVGVWHLFYRSRLCNIDLSSVRAVQHRGNCSECFFFIDCALSPYIAGGRAGQHGCSDGQQPGFYYQCSVARHSGSRAAGCECAHARAGARKVGEQ